MKPAFAAITYHHSLLHINGDGTIYWPSQELLIVSDLHLEKGAALSQGAPLPQYDTKDTLQRLTKRLDAHQPKQILCLGDSFHTAERAFRMPPDQLAFISQLAQHSDFMWVTGNHDTRLPDRLPGTITDETMIEGIRLCHEVSTPSQSPTISGHYHPKARVNLRTRALSARCFIENRTDLIMPAFGSYTGGLNIRDAALSPFISRQSKIHLIHDGTTYSMPYQARLFTQKTQ